jgi:hypothetical protein
MGAFYDHILSDFCPGVYRVLEANRGLRILAKAGGYAALAFLVVIVVAVTRLLIVLGTSSTSMTLPFGLLAIGWWASTARAICE